MWLLKMKRSTSTSDIESWISDTESSMSDIESWISDIESWISDIEICKFLFKFVPRNSILYKKAFDYRTLGLRFTKLDYCHSFHYYESF